MTIFLTADCHFRHARIIEYTGRPYASVYEMDEDLIARWNATVAPSDVVHVLGDVVMGDIERSLALVRRLNGTLHLLAGNHDRVFRQNPFAVRSDWEARYRDAGFASISHGVIEIDLGRDRRVRACHFPPSGDRRETDRYPEHRPKDDGAPLVHGHTHGAWRQRGMWIDVGTDAWAGAPVPAATICRLIDEGPHELEPLPWAAPPRRRR